MTLISGAQEFRSNLSGLFLQLFLRSTSHYMASFKGMMEYDEMYPISIIRLGEEVKKLYKKMKRDNRATLDNIRVPELDHKAQVDWTKFCFPTILDESAQFCDFRAKWTFQHRFGILHNYGDPKTLSRERLLTTLTKDNKNIKKRASK